MRALAADMAGRRVVGAHRPALDEGVRDDVRAAGERDGGGERLGRGVGVRARVEQDLRLHLHQPALGVGVVAVAQQGRVAVGVAEEGLLAGRGQLHRAAGLSASRPSGSWKPGSSRSPVAPGTPVTTTLTWSGSRPKQAAARSRSVCGSVEAGVDLHAAVGPGHGEPGLGADRGRVLAADAVQALDDDLADRVRVAVAQRDVPDQVAVGVQRLGLEGLLGVGDRVEHLVLDGDGGGGHPRGVGVVGGDGGDGLAVVAYDVGGEHRAVGRAAAVRRRRRGRRRG